MTACIMQLYIRHRVVYDSGYMALNLLAISALMYHTRCSNSAHVTSDHGRYK
jgi:hypothetical protein